MGVNKQQKEIVSPAGPAETGPAVFLCLTSFGTEQAAMEADKQREQAEKGRKRPRRSVDRGER